MSLKSSEWFTEAYENLTAFSVRFSRKLHEAQSRYQKIEVFETDAMGRVLILDGCFMVTDRDSFIYHEMLVHPAVAVVREPRRILIIGGGDGGAVTEAVKHPQVESVTLCEIDERVTGVCREYFPRMSQGLDDPRVTVVHDDGAAFAARRPGEFDIVLVDSTDPVGPGKVLFEMPFFESVRESLTEGGIAVFQTESPLFMADTFAGAVKNLRDVFGRSAARPYLATIPSYPGGLWSFTFCSRDRDPLRDAPTAMPPGLTHILSYYDDEVHRAAFALPLFVRRIVDGAPA